MNLSFQDKLKLIPTCSVLIVKELYIVWNSPPKDTFKINVNESRIFHEKSCSCCCITRDSLDCCIKDFKLEPLLWLLRYGICYITFVLQDNFQPLHATWKYTQRYYYHFIKNGCTTIANLKPPLDEIFNLMNDYYWQIHINHIYRETNSLRRWSYSPRSFRRLAILDDHPLSMF